MQLLWKGLIRGDSMKDIYVNMSEINLDGDIIDFSVKGNTIIPEIVDNMKSLNQDMGCEKDYRKWDCKKDLTEEINEKYDYVLFFFSLNIVFGERKYDKLIKDAKKILKEDGTLIIWDIASLPLTINKYNIRVRISNEKIITMPYMLGFNPFRVKYTKAIDILKRNGFNISKNNIKNDYYYIEANTAKEG